MTTQEKDREGVVSQLREQLQKREEIIFAYLHGSFVEGGPFKDIDLAVYVDEAKVSKDKCLEYEITLAVDLQSSLSKPIDVKILNHAPLGFQYYATAGKLLLTRDDEKRVDFVTLARSLYLDFQIESQKYLWELARG